MDIENPNCAVMYLLHAPVSKPRYQRRRRLVIQNTSLSSLYSRGRLDWKWKRYIYLEHLYWCNSSLDTQLRILAQKASCTILCKEFHFRLVYNYDTSLKSPINKVRRTSRCLLLRKSIYYSSFIFRTFNICVIRLILWYCNRFRSTICNVTISSPNNLTITTMR